MNCKVIVNADSGNYNRLDLDKLLNSLGCVNAQVELINSDSDWSAENVDTVIVCGGDGTLHNALEKCRDKRIVYAPCGTLNEAAHINGAITSIGKINGMPFSYVCAAGSFTEIGYSAKNRSKQRFKALAYLPQVFSSYRCRKIHALIDADGNKTEDDFSLIMVIKSSRCFGFEFNKCYRKNEGLYLVAVRSFGEDNLVNRIKMFVPFFRVFFCGVKQPRQTKNWQVIPFENLSVRLDTPQNFCVDGEKRVLSGELRFCKQILSRQIDVVKTPFLRRAKHCGNDGKKFP